MVNVKAMHMQIVGTDSPTQRAATAVCGSGNETTPVGVIYNAQLVNYLLIDLD